MDFKTNMYVVAAFIFSLLITADVTAGIKSIAPAHACNLLSSIGLSTFGWKTYFDTECGCSSRSIPLGAGNPFRNGISYYVEGDGNTVHLIRLIVNVLNPEQAEIAHAEFQKVALLLIRQLISTPVSANFSQAIANGRNQIFLADGFLFMVERKEWTMRSDRGTRQCYEIRLIIR